jgi:hypothetical protein
MIVVGSSTAGVDSFKWIPYAQPPVGPLRQNPPQTITSNLGTVQATGLPRACPQYLLDTSSVPTGVIGQLLDAPILQTATDSGETASPSMSKGRPVPPQTPSQSPSGSMAAPSNLDQRKHIMPVN